MVDWPWFRNMLRSAFLTGISWSTDITLSGNQYIYDMVIDVDNTIWLATYNGIIRYKDTQTVSYFANDSYGYNYVTFIAIDLNGQIWAGLSYTGLVVYNGSSWSTYSTSNGLSSNYLTDILFDSRGRIWVLADNGVNMSAHFTGIEEPGSIPPEKIAIYPNPFSGYFDIQYSSSNVGLC